MVNMEAVEITDAQQAIQWEAKRLRDQGVSLIIALGNAGFEQAKTLLEKLEDVDIIVNGGSGDTFLYSGELNLFSDRSNIKRIS